MALPRLRIPALSLPFAGWREEALGWFRSRAPNEQRLLRIGAVAVPVLLVLSVVSGLHTVVGKLERRVETKRADLAYLRSVLPVLENAPHPTTDGQTLVGVVDASSREAGLTLAGTDPIGTTQLKVRLDNAPFDSLVGWLIRLQQTSGVAVQSAAIERTANPGQVNATLTLNRP
jgi:general secretion pathway protein M